MNPRVKAYIQLHIAVLLFGITAILGKLISLAPLQLVWWRVFLTSLSLFVLIGFGARLKKIPRKRIMQYMGIGIIVGLHWITFFASIKYANASICLVCMATTSFFTAFSEPVIMKYKPRKYEILLGMAVIPAMILIVDFNELDIRIGVLMGLISAFLASLFGSFNKKFVHDADSLSITFLELSSACIFISLVLGFNFFVFESTHAFIPEGKDWIYLIILALGCTTFAYVLALRSLKVITAFAANLVINLEPVYGILLAIVILNEHRELPPKFYLGFLVIILIILSFPYFRKKFETSK